MKEGLIIAIKKQGPVVLEKTGAFAQLQMAGDHLVGHTIGYNESDIYNPIRVKNYYPQIIAAILIIALVLISVTEMARFQGSYASIITIDINPSIELQINRDNRVNQVSCLNNDSEVLLRGTHLVGLKLDKALSIILKAAMEAHYFDTNKDVLIGTAFIDQQGSDDYKEKIRSTLAREEENYQEIVAFTLLEVDQQTVELAKAKGMSIGKYQAYQELEKSITIEEYVKLDVPKIVASLNNPVILANEQTIEKETKVTKKDTKETETLSTLTLSSVVNEEENFQEPIELEESLPVTPVTEKPIETKSKTESTSKKTEVETPKPTINPNDEMEKVVVDDTVISETKIVIEDEGLGEKVVMGDVIATEDVE